MLRLPLVGERRAFFGEGVILRTVTSFLLF